MLRITKMELELISAIGMYLFFEKRISYIAKRFSKANNKFMQSYDVNEPSKFIVYLDGNSLHGWAMVQYFPFGGFKWLNQKELDKLCLNLIRCNSIEENSSIGYILEVDLEYPDELRELHNNYPLALEKFEISHSMSSNYCSSIADKHDLKISGANKLVPNLDNASKYVLDYKNLQQYLLLEMK